MRQNAPSAGRGSGDISIIAIPVAMAPAFKFGVPKELFTGTYAINQPARAFDVTPNGQAFFLIESREPAPAWITHIRVVQNWFEDLNHLAPRK